jgi:hypothetical protein
VSSTRDALWRRITYKEPRSYPEDNCGVNGNYLNAQDIYPEWLNHTSVTSLTAPYLDGTRQALAAGKEMIMFETNTASCGGFAGLSDSFAATLWYVYMLSTKWFLSHATFFQDGGLCPTNGLPKLHGCAYPCWWTKHLLQRESNCNPCHSCQSSYSLFTLL